MLSLSKDDRSSEMTSDWWGPWWQVEGLFVLWWIQINIHSFSTTVCKALTRGGGREHQQPILAHVRCRVGLHPGQDSSLSHDHPMRQTTLTPRNNSGFLLSLISSDCRRKPESRLLKYLEKKPRQNTKKTPHRKASVRAIPEKKNSLLRGNCCHSGGNRVLKTTITSFLCWIKNTSLLETLTLDYFEFSFIKMANNPFASPTRGIFLWSLHASLRVLWVPFRSSCFFPHSKDRPVNVIGKSKLPVGVDCYLSL